MLKVTSRVYIGRLNNSVRERDIEKFFASYGRVRDVLLKNGYGFVEFEDHRDADDAVYELNGKELCGDRVLLEHARGPIRRPGGGGGGYGGRDRDHGGGGGARRPVWLDKYGPPTRTDYRVIIENLSSRVSWQDLKDYVRTVGEVSYAEAHREKKNVGVVEFVSLKDMKNAMDKLNGTELNGRKLVFIDDYKPRNKRRSDSRSRSRTRSRSRDRSRSRSRSRRSRSRSRRSRSKSHRSGSKSRSRSRSKRRERSSITKNDRKEKSRSRSASRSRSRTRDREDDKDHANGRNDD